MRAGLLAAVLLFGCGTSTLGKINAINESAKNLTAQITPAWDADCITAAKKCAAAGVDIKQKCPELVSCEKAQDAFYDAVNTVHLLCAGAAAAEQLGKAKDLETTYRRVRDLLEKAYDMAKKAGFLEGT